DLIFCMGTWPGTFIKDMGIEDIPIMVYFSVDPVGSGIAKSAEDSGQDNLWCHINDNVYYKQLEFYHENFAFQNLGIVYYDEAVAAMRAYRDVAETVGFQVTEVKVNQLTETGTEVETWYYENLKNTFQTLILESHIDAFLLSTDILKDESKIKEMLQPFYQHKIPVLVQNGEYFVQQGALMMVTASDAREQAPFVADTLAEILHGTMPRQMRQEYLSPPYLSINVGAADALGYQVPDDLIISAEHIYE
ncbi:MAG: ABC transporter substrate binding protein, partial [Clostridium sp.]